MGSNMFSLEPDLATGNMVQSQISMSVRALLPPGVKHFISQAWTECKKKKKKHWMCGHVCAQIQSKLINTLWEVVCVWLVFIFIKIQTYDTMLQTISYVTLQMQPYHWSGKCHIDNSHCMVHFYYVPQNYELCSTELQHIFLSVLL